MFTEVKTICLLSVGQFTSFFLNILHCTRLLNYLSPSPNTFTVTEHEAELKPLE